MTSNIVIYKLKVRTRGTTKPKLITQDTGQGKEEVISINSLVHKHVLSIDAHQIYGAVAWLSIPMSECMLKVVGFRFLTQKLVQHTFLLASNLYPCNICR